MKVSILEPKGYCAGVAHAIKVALQAKEDYPNKNVYILGMLVHNHHVVNLLNDKGIKMVKSFDSIGDGDVIVFNADGHSKEQREIAESKHLIIYDAICPKVASNLKKIVDEITSGHQVIYIGQEHHQETQIAIGVIEGVCFYDEKKKFDYSLIKDPSPFVLNQTTLNSLDIVNLHKDILSHIPGARISNEICPTTRKRQEAVQYLDDDVDAVIVVGDQVSSNSKRLFEIAKSTHPNIDVFMVSDPEEVDVEALKNKKHIAISSGASTPRDVIDIIYQNLITLE
ncbi:MAG: 4-hydroxy-3-methylbut-2-enyl diphosphate reductase [Bacilli bacterium]|nr:4-hydroxy-3-methylbut-2-enyl diphosphate reductase [Bacilli bacterium]